MYNFQLEEPLTFDDNVSPVCLPSISTTIPEDSQVIITGFGYANGEIDLFIGRMKYDYRSI